MMSSFKIYPEDLSSGFPGGVNFKRTVYDDEYLMQNNLNCVKQEPPESLEFKGIYPNCNPVIKDSNESCPLSPSCLSGSMGFDNVDDVANDEKEGDDDKSIFETSSMLDTSVLGVVGDRNLDVDLRDFDECSSFSPFPPTPKRREPREGDTSAEDGRKAFSCSKCTRKFAHKRSVVRHNLRFHNDDRQPFSKFLCRQCNRGFHSKLELSAHVGRHQGVKTYPCFHCGKKFATSTKRNIHIRVHTNERPYSCDVCGDAFKQKCHLKKHVKRKHSGC